MNPPRPNAEMREGIWPGNDSFHLFNSMIGAGSIHPVQDRTRRNAWQHSLNFSSALYRCLAAAAISRSGNRDNVFMSSISFSRGAVAHE
jgi:hypothetical protein